MSFLVRRVVVSLLVPFLWGRWRERAARRAATGADGRDARHLRSPGE